MWIRVVLLVAAFATPAWYFDALVRVASAWGQFRHHKLPFYALAFLVAPQSEVRPRAWAQPCAGCLEFDVDAPDAHALDARLEFDSGARWPAAVRASHRSEYLEFSLRIERPIDAWLTWKPHSSDPGFGISPPPCGQALSEIGVRPTRRGEGRVGVRLTLTRKPDGVLDYRLHGDQPYVP